MIEKKIKENGEHFCILVCYFFNTKWNQSTDAGLDGWNTPAWKCSTRICKSILSTLNTKCKIPNAEFQMLNIMQYREVRHSHIIIMQNTPAWKCSTRIYKSILSTLNTKCQIPNAEFQMLNIMQYTKVILTLNSNPHPLPFLNPP